MGHFADVEVAVGVDGYAVGGGEVSRVFAGGGFAEAGLEVALFVVDTDAMAEAGSVDDVDVGRHFRHVEVAVCVHVEARGAPDAGPLSLKLAAGGEDLDAMVLAVGDENVFVAVNDDVVGDDELALAGAGFSPGVDELALGAEAVDVGVAVAVGDEEVAGNGGDGKMSGAVEGLAAESIGRPADGLEQFAFRSELSDDVMLGIGAVDGVVGADGDAVGASEDAVAPGGDVGAVWVEDYDGVFAAGVYEDSALGVDNGAGTIA